MKQGQFLIARLLSASILAGVGGCAQAESPSAWDIAKTDLPFKEVTITTESGTWMSVDVSPDGETLVFDMLGDIYTTPVAGGEATLVRGGPAIERHPRFSPNGEMIAFISDVSGMGDIWVSDLKSGESRQVSAEVANTLNSPAWSPDGEYIAATRHAITAHAFASEIALYHVDGGTGHTLVDMPETMKSVSEPVFSPDGSAVYYTEAVSMDLFPSDASQENFVVKRYDLESGKSKKLLGGWGSATTPQVSPDGKRIAFIRRVKDKTVLFVYDIESGKQTPVYDDLPRDGHVSINNYGYYPHFDWSPDNRNVVLWGKGKFLKVDTESAQAEEISFKATATHRIISVPRFDVDLDQETFKVQGIDMVTTSPDGKQVVFSALGSLWRKKLPDGEPERLTDAREFEYDPVYSHDGQRILYVSWDDEQGGAVKAVSAEGGEGKSIVESTAVLRQPSWSRDDKKIAYVVANPSDLLGGYRVEPGVYWVAIDRGEPGKVADGKRPVFSADSERILYEAANPASKSRGALLKSVRLDGLDERTHVESQFAYNYALSPNGKWLAFTQHYNIHVVPYKDIGKPLNVHQQSTEAEINSVSNSAGWAAHWSAGSNTLHWQLGDKYHSTDVNEFGDSSSEAVPLGLVGTTDRPQGAIAFTNARIITMGNSGVIDRGTVVVEGNRILSVGANVAIPADAKVFDLDGKTLMPGLIDAHGHLNLFQNGINPQKHPMHYAQVAFGVTANMDPSTSDHMAIRSTELQRANRTVGPRYLATGDVLYGAADSPYHAGITSLDTANSAMERKGELGFSYVKSYAQRNRWHRQQIIQAAHKHRKLVITESAFHFYENLSMLLDGSTTIEHNNTVGDYYEDVLKLMSAGDTAITPTLLVNTGEVFGENFFYQDSKPWLHPKIKSFVHQTIGITNPIVAGASQSPWVRGSRVLKQDDALWDIGFKKDALNMKKASDLGVLVNSGAHGQINGIGMHWEMWAFAEGGMEPMDVLRTATINPAVTLGLDKEIGSIEVGKLADLIILDKNPLEDIRNTDSVIYTMVNGRLYDAFTMDEIGNYDHPRTKFFWELPDYNGIDWVETDSGVDMTPLGGATPHHH